MTLTRKRDRFWNSYPLSDLSLFLCNDSEEFSEDEPSCACPVVGEARCAESASKQHARTLARGACGAMYVMRMRKTTGRGVIPQKKPLSLYFSAVLRYWRV